jgi:hypothetical protein
MPVAINVLFIHLFVRSFYLLLAIFSGRNWSFRVKSRQRKKERKKERETRSDVLESTTYGTLPAAVAAFYLSRWAKPREILRSLFPLIHNSDLRNFSDGHKNYGTSMIRLRLCSSYCIIHE